MAGARLRLLRRSRTHHQQRESKPENIYTQYSCVSRPVRNILETSSFRENTNVKQRHPILDGLQREADQNQANSEDAHALLRAHDPQTIR